MALIKPLLQPTRRKRSLIERWDKTAAVEQIGSIHRMPGQTIELHDDFLPRFVIGFRCFSCMRMTAAGFPIPAKIRRTDLPRFR